jgi:uncharacterized membrane protein/sporulation protein YlmC with PRC-barrel domain
MSESATPGAAGQGRGPVPGLQLPIDARVHATDGEVGQLTDVIVNPAARRVSHIVVAENSLAGREFLVPIERIVASDRQTVRLDCTREEVGRFPEFTSTRYVPITSPEAQPALDAIQATMTPTPYGDFGYAPFGYEPLALRYGMTDDGKVAVLDRTVPEGGLAVDSGSRVVSSDGKDVGEVEAFLLGGDGTAITHVVLRRGRLARAVEVTLPVSTVAGAGDGTARLSLSAEEVERLPAVPVGRRTYGAGGGQGALDLLGLVFPAPESADEGLRLLKEAAQRGEVQAFDAAVLSKAPDGRLRTREEHDISAGRGALVGAVAGAALSLLAGPVGLVAGAAAGGATGGVVGGLIDRGVPDRYVRDLGHALRPGSSALIVLVAAGSAERYEEHLSALNGSSLRLALTDEMISRLTSGG